MAANVPEPQVVALLHNDYKYDNVVLDSNEPTRIIGLLDWEMCTLGDPLADLGTALAYWVDANDPPELQARTWGPTAYPGSFTRGEVVRHYGRKSGLDVSRIDFYLAFARFKLAVIVQQIYFRYYQGLTQDKRFASMPATVAMLMQAALHCAETGRL